MTRTALILGATGGFGGAMAEALWNAGWRVRQFDRKTDDLATAAQGVDIIVNGWNPSYEHQAAQVPILTQKVIAAAKANGARIVIAGSIYGYGAGSAPALTESTPMRATNTLGRSRIEMEEAYRTSGVSFLILRAGDFLGTSSGNRWFDTLIAGKLAKGRIAYPGDLDAPHAWAFLPDVARAGVQLLDRTDLPKQIALPVAGMTLTGRQLATALSDVTGRKIKARRMAWWPFRLASLVWPLGRHLVEMRYLWSMPHWLDPSPLETWLPNFTPTPLHEALAASHPVNTLITDPAANQDQPRQAHGGLPLPQASPAPAK